jgi:hypothetical protein
MVVCVTTGGAELSSMAAGLAVGKPGDAIKSPDAGTQPAEGRGATVEHQGLYYGV